MKNEVIAYARNEDGTPTGCLVGRKVDEEGTVLVGWSGYNLSGEPKPFSKTEALRIARDRIAKGTSGKVVPRRMRPMLPWFQERCSQFFHSDCVIVVGSTTEARDLR